MSHRPLATVQEVADFLNLKDTKTLRNWMRTGYGPTPHKIGGVIRYRWAEVESFVEQSAVFKFVDAEGEHGASEIRISTATDEDLAEAEPERCGCIS